MKRCYLLAPIWPLAWLFTLPWRVVDGSPNNAMYIELTIIPLCAWLRGARTWSEVENSP